jgi:hypothetical protein
MDKINRLSEIFRANMQKNLDVSSLSLDMYHFFRLDFGRLDSRSINWASIR